MKVSRPVSRRVPIADVSVGIVVNPERAGAADEIVERLTAVGVSATVRRPARADEVGPAAAELVDAGVTIVAAVGGDGTQRAVASAITGTDAALAVVPAGTVNLLGRVLGVTDLDTAAAALAHGEARSIDVGELSDERGRSTGFVLNASTGWDASVIDRVGDGYKRFGRLGYTAAGIRQWFAERPRAVRVELGGRPWFDGPAMTVLVLNVVQRGSAAFDLAPSSSHDEGRLDIVVVRRHSVAGLARAVWAILRGRAPRPADVVRATAERASVTWETAVAAQVDGDEIEPGRAFAYAARPGALRVVVPGGDHTATG